MDKSITEAVEPSRATYEALEGIVRQRVQEYIQDILEEEVEDLFREEEIREDQEGG